MEHLFISDLHLSPQRPGTVSLFLRFLRERAVQGASLYILGDLFDAWIGDDDSRPPIPEIVAALRQLADRGTQLFLSREIAIFWSARHSRKPADVVCCRTRRC